jgi:hypothetical protein
MRKALPLFILNWAGVFSSRANLSSWKIYFYFVFSCGVDFSSGALYLLFITFLWGRLLFWDLLNSFETSLICSMVVR